MKRAPTQAEMEAVEQKLAGWSQTFLVIIGAWLILAPLAPQFTGYAWFEDLMGGAGAVARFFAGFLFLYFAGIVREKNDLRLTLRRLLRAAKAPSESQDEQVRTAIDLLIRGLDADRDDTRRSALENLKRLTGQDLGDDKAAWERWWAEHRDTFKKGGGPP